MADAQLPISATESHDVVQLERLDEWFQEIQDNSLQLKCSSYLFAPGHYRQMVSTTFGRPAPLDGFMRESTHQRAPYVSHWNIIAPKKAPMKMQMMM